MTFSVAHEVYCAEPEQQAMALMHVYHLAQQYITTHPLMVNTKVHSISLFSSWKLTWHCAVTLSIANPTC
jgi:hypothetical protein